tara:strand:- start:19 stop:1029 length:1011 start_codon:yes stop_codon:yes gene_type:complete
MIDIIICTYNRPKKVLELTNELISCTSNSQKIIIIDSSDKENKKIQKINQVVYVRSVQKNQPYQRFLGYHYSKSEYILYLDDDMELIEKEFLCKIEELLNTNNLSGIALNFRDKHNDTTLKSIPKSNLFSRSKFIHNIKNWLTGYTNPPEGKLGLCGIRGNQPEQLSLTEYVSGGAFIAKRDALFKNFNFQLFDIFEEKIGMGEDALIGYSLSKNGKLFFDPNIYFLHNDSKDSSYSQNLEAYSKRVLFSRLYLSLEKLRIDGKGVLLGKIHFHWYAFCRIIGLLLNLISKPSQDMLSVFVGSNKGWILTFGFKFYSNLERNKFWEIRVEEDLNKN